jgi:hypothetical protein
MKSEHEGKLVRKPYIKPQVQVYGSLGQITKSNTGVCNGDGTTCTPSPNNKTH